MVRRRHERVPENEDEILVATRNKENREGMGHDHKITYHRAKERIHLSLPECWPVRDCSIPRGI